MVYHNAFNDIIYYSTFHLCFIPTGCNQTVTVVFLLQLSGYSYYPYKTIIVGGVGIVDTVQYWGDSLNVYHFKTDNRDKDLTVNHLGLVC